MKKGIEVKQMKSYVVFLVLVFSSLCSIAQRWQLGLMAGGTNYQGELQEKKYDLEQARFVFGASVTYQPGNRLSFRGELFKGNVTGSDHTSSDLSAVQRNLSFATRLYEMSFTGKLSLLDQNNHILSPYIFAGAAVYRINPYTFAADGEKVYLIPLSTEGQGLANYPDRKPASWYNFSIPFGAGLSARLNNYFSVELELGFRKTFTDYIDDVSSYYADPTVILNAKGSRALELAYRGDELPNGNPSYPGTGSLRGTPNSKDWYYATVLRLNYTFGGNANGGNAAGPRYNSRQYSCPSVF